MTDPGAGLIHAPAHATAVIAGTTPEEILQNAAHIAGPLKDLIEKQGLYTSMGTDKRTGKERRHVEVSGWQAAGAMLAAMGGTPIHAHSVWTRRMDRNDDVIAYEAHVEIRTINGDVVGAAEAMCSNGESKRSGADEFAIRSMAETRAESRAYRKAIGWIISLAGFSPTPAEEMADASGGTGGSEDPGRKSLPSWAEPMNDVGGVAANLTRVLKAAGVENAGEFVSRIGNDIFKRADGGFPFIAARVVHLLAEAVDPPAEEVTATVEPEGQMTAEATRAEADEDTATTEEK